jgi:hypothetical protein
MAKEITESQHAQGDGHAAGPTAGHGDQATPGAPLRSYLRSGGSFAAASEGDLAAKVCYTYRISIFECKDIEHGA